MWPLTLAALTTLVLALPLVPSVLEWRRRRDIRPLPIDAEHTLDVAAVAEDFHAMIDRQGDAPEGGDVVHPVSSLRPVTYVTGAFVPTVAEAVRGTCKRTLVARESLVLPDNYVFSRDLYGRRSICTGRNNRVQALLSDGEIVMRDGSELHRWAHAAHVYVEPRCRLLGPVSALRTLRLDEGCRFASASADMIAFGPHALTPTDTAATLGQEDPAAWDEAMAGPAALNGDGRWLVTEDFTFPANRQFHGDLVVHGNLWIGAGARIAGSVKASGGIWLGAGVRIDGALIAGGTMSVARGCALGGPVVAEEEIDVGARCLIGAPGSRTTLVAPVLRVAVGALLYGAVSALEEGRVVADNHAGRPWSVHASAS